MIPGSTSLSDRDRSRAGAGSAHFHDIYIDGKEHAKMTGDRIKMLMLTLPFMVSS